MGPQVYQPIAAMSCHPPEIKLLLLLLEHSTFTSLNHYFTC
jgi:hypothetical protein